MGDLKKSAREVTAKQDISEILEIFRNLKTREKRYENFKAGDVIACR